MIEWVKITFNFISNYEFHNGLRNPGLYSLISHKSAAADEKRTLVGNDTTSGSFTVEKNRENKASYKVKVKKVEILLCNRLLKNVVIKNLIKW